MDADSKPGAVASPLPDRPVNDRPPETAPPEEPSESPAADEEEQYAAQLRAEQRAEALASQEAASAAVASTPANTTGGVGATAARASALGGLAASAARGNVAGVASGARNVYKFYTALGALFTLVGTIPSFFYLNYYILRSLLGSPKYPAGIVEKMIVAVMDTLVVITLILVIANLFLAVCVVRHPLRFPLEGFSVCTE